MHCDHLEAIYTVISGSSRTLFRCAGKASGHALDICGAEGIVVIDEFGEEILRMTAGEIAGEDAPVKLCAS